MTDFDYGIDDYKYLSAVPLSAMSERGAERVLKHPRTAVTVEFLGETIADPDHQQTTISKPRRRVLTDAEGNDYYRDRFTVEVVTRPEAADTDADDLDEKEADGTADDDAAEEDQIAPSGDDDPADADTEPDETESEQPDEADDDDAEESEPEVRHVLQPDGTVKEVRDDE